MLWGCLTPERLEKTHRIIGSLAAGWGDGARLVVGEAPDDGNPFAVWGQKWLTLDIVPPAIRAGRPFWHIDNGFVNSAGGRTTGYYRITYRSLSAVLLRDVPGARADALGKTLRPWRVTGRHILLALPGMDYGRAVGLDMRDWCVSIDTELRRRTDRVIVSRSKGTQQPLALDLRNCWAVVTHSSNVAVDAVMAGIPVVVAPTSPAAPVGNLDLAAIERPEMPDRMAWWASLACQQFTLDEMHSGEAFEYLAMVRRQVDDER